MCSSCTRVIKTTSTLCEDLILIESCNIYVPVISENGGVHKISYFDPKSSLPSVIYHCIYICVLYLYGCNGVHPSRFILYYLNMAILFVIFFFFFPRAILEIKTSLTFPLFQWLLYLMVLIWFFAVAAYLSSMKLYVFKVKDLANDKSCFCNNTYKVLKLKYRIH